jgi:ribosomal protein S27AE
MSRRAQGQIRRSQVITTCGPGALAHHTKRVRESCAACHLPRTEVCLAGTELLETRSAGSQ